MNLLHWILSIAFFLAHDAPVVWSGAVELPDGSKLEFSVELMKDSGTITIPMQRAKDLPLSGVSVTDKELKFSIPSAGAVWELKISDDGKTAEGVLKQGAELKTTMRRLAAGDAVVKELVRAQEPKPPYPYDATEVRFENAPAGVVLAGTLTTPRGAGPFPCVVMITGSGPQDRDESLLGHRPFLVIADHLARHGIAALRYDDRGIGKSTGGFANATSDDFALDALAAVEFLGTRKGIDAKHVGIVGHSEGGLIAPMCAARSKQVAFLVLLAGTGLRGAELLPIQTRLICLAQGAPPAEAEQQEKDLAEILAMMGAGRSDDDLKGRIRLAAMRQLRAAPETRALPQATLDTRADQVVAEQATELLGPWFRRFLVIDPRESLGHVQCPVLAVNGEKDLQVPPKENLPRIEKALKDAGNPDVTVLELPGLNHLFQTCKTGSPAEYGEIQETISPAALDVISEWIRKRTGLSK